MTGVGANSPNKKVSVPTKVSEDNALKREIQIEDPYEDDDFKIYFDKNSLLAHINFLEDDNLFKINLL